MRATGPDELVGWIAAVGILAAMIWRAVGWFFCGTLPPDPWDEATTARLEDADLKPLCTRCLCPHEETDWFCPNCGMAASPTTNYMPYLIYLSLGDVVRHGTTGDIPLHWTCICGYILMSAGCYVGIGVFSVVGVPRLLDPLAAIPGLVLLALYWRRLAGNIHRRRSELNHRLTETGADINAAPAG